MSDPHFYHDRERSLARAARDMRPGLDILEPPTPEQIERIEAVLAKCREAILEAFEADGDLESKSIMVVAANIPFLVLHLAFPVNDPLGRELQAFGLGLVETTVPSIARDRLRRLEAGLTP